MEDKLKCHDSFAENDTPSVLSIWPNELGCRVYKILVTRAAVA